MSVSTTGSTVQGTVQGLARGLGASGLDIGKVTNVVGNPDGIVTSTPVSGIAWDGTNGKFYMFLGGSSWLTLGSVA